MNEDREGKGEATNIQAQPRLPPIPSILDIAAASRPPKDPGTAAAEN